MQPSAMSQSQAGACKHEISVLDPITLVRMASAPGPVIGPVASGNSEILALKHTVDATSKSHVGLSAVNRKTPH